MRPDKKFIIFEPGTPIKKSLTAVEKKILKTKIETANYQLEDLTLALDEGVISPEEYDRLDVERSDRTRHHYYGSK